MPAAQVNSFDLDDRSILTCPYPLPSNPQKVLQSMTKVGPASNGADGSPTPKVCLANNKALFCRSFPCSLNGLWLSDTIAICSHLTVTHRVSSTTCFALAFLGFPSITVPHRFSFQHIFVSQPAVFFQVIRHVPITVTEPLSPFVVASLVCAEDLLARSTTTQLGVLFKFLCGHHCSRHTFSPLSLKS